MILAPRYLPRLAATVGLFTRYGLTDFAKQQGLQELVDEPTDGENGNGASRGATLAAAFRKRLVELGPAYVKLGQVLSTRPDLLPSPYIRELEHLQDDVGRLALDQVECIVEEELGGRLSKLFLSFEQEPLASASLGQVHAAQLRDGRPVVVKVQRPHIRAAMADDLAFFHALAEFLSEHTKAGARFDMVGIVQQLERALTDELDYRIEARNAAVFRRALAEFPRILVPRVIEAYSAERVLTTDRVRGIKIDAISPLTHMEHDFRPLAEELTRAYLKQITIDGHFHADPHPGNVFVMLPDMDNPFTPSEVKTIDRRAAPRATPTPLSRIEKKAQDEAPIRPDDVDVMLAMIDFGMTARLSPSLREQIARLLLDIADNRGDDAAATLIEIGSPLASFERVAYSHDIAGLVARNYDLAIGELQAGALLFELINISFQRGLRLPAELTLFAKALFNLDAITRALDPTFSPIETIRGFSVQLATDHAKRELNPSRLYHLATKASSLLTALPHRLDLITERLAANEFATRVDVPQLPALIDALQKVANRIFSGLVLAGLLAASAWLMPYSRPLGTAGFVLAGVIGIWMVLAILWTDRAKE